MDKEIFIGKTFTECKSLIEKENTIFEQKYQCRIVKVDGIHQIITCDFLTNRFNLIIDKDIVINVYVG